MLTAFTCLDEQAGPSGTHNSRVGPAYLTTMISSNGLRAIPATGTMQSSVG